MDSVKTQVEYNFQDFPVKQKFDDPHRTANGLLLNAGFIDNPGLLKGKMGIAIFFFKLANKTGNKIYEDFAGNLIETVFREIHTSSPVDFASGLTGIGCGIEYLIQKGFVEAGDDNILEELDNAIFQLDRKNPQLPRFYDDFYSYGLYYLYRSKNEVWNTDVLQLIWNDLTALLNDTLTADVKISSAYIISLLYFILEIKKRSFCPPGVDKIISAIPEFVAKYTDGNLNDIEYRCLELLFRDLGIYKSWQPHTIINQYTVKEQVQLSCPAAIYEIAFPNIQFTDKFVPEFETLAPDFLYFNEVWDKIFRVPDKKNPGLPPGLIGYAFSLLKTDHISSNIPVTHSTPRDTIIIFNRKGRASEYGIGTYIKELTSGLKNKTYNVTVVHLEADQAEFTIEDLDGILNWYIPLSRNFGSSGKSYNEYYRCIVVLLQLYIKHTGKLIFHFNSMRDHQLAVYLREVFECKILLIVHYMDWSIALQGDLSKMKKILSQSKEKITDPLEKKALKFFEEDRKFLKEADHIVCLADYTRDILNQDYGIIVDKITVINNGLYDKSKTLTPEERSVLKDKYRINSEEKIILYAGRLDEIKGIGYLIKAFKQVLQHEPYSRLWIIGDGAYNPLLKEAEGIWNKLCFTGRISREQLFELYSVADIGVIPSLFEPFGYVAVEMMMHGLPLVVTDTTGLDEIVEDEVSGLKVRISALENGNEVDTVQMAQRIVFLLQDPAERRRLGHNGRNRYLKKFTGAIMCEKMMNCYQELLQSIPARQSHTITL